MECLFGVCAYYPGISRYFCVCAAILRGQLEKQGTGKGWEQERSQK